MLYGRSCQRPWAPRGASAPFSGASSRRAFRPRPRRPRWRSLGPWWRLGVGKTVPRGCVLRAKCQEKTCKNQGNWGFNIVLWCFMRVGKNWFKLVVEKYQQQICVLADKIWWVKPHTIAPLSMYIHTWKRRSFVLLVPFFLRNQTLPDLVLLVYLKDDSRFGFTNNYCICICGLWIILIPLWEPAPVVQQ